MAEAPRGMVVVATVVPHSQRVVSTYIPAAHIEDEQPVFSQQTYRVFSYGLVILLVVGLVVVVGGLAFIKNQEKSRKRYF